MGKVEGLEELRPSCQFTVSLPQDLQDQALCIRSRHVPLPFHHRSVGRNIFRLGKIFVFGLLLYVPATTGSSVHLVLPQLMLPTFKSVRQLALDGPPDVAATLGKSRTTRLLLPAPAAVR
jgi:hypothetical protein